MLLPAWLWFGPDMADGFVIHEPSPNVIDVGAAAEAGGRPVVYSNWGDNRSVVVAPDNVGAAARAVQYLAARGRRAIAFIHGRAGNNHAEQRLKGFRVGLKAAGLAWDERLFAIGHFTAAGGYAAAGELLGRDVAFDAIVCANDNSAFGALMRLHQAGKRVPEDVALLGWDNADSSRFSDPPLTTFENSHFVRGRCSVQLLTRRLRGEQVGLGEHSLPMQLLERQSTGADPLRLRGPAAASTQTAAMLAELVRGGAVSSLDEAHELMERNLRDALAAEDFFAALLAFSSDLVRFLGGNFTTAELSATLRAFLDPITPPARKAEVTLGLQNVAHLLLDAMQPDQSGGALFEAPVRMRLRRHVYANVTADQPLARTIESVLEFFAREDIDRVLLWLRPDVFKAAGGFVYCRGFRSPPQPGEPPAFLRALLAGEDNPVRLRMSPLWVGEQDLGFIILNLDHPAAGLWDELVLAVATALNHALLFEMLAASNEQLRVARIAAEEASNAKSRFLATVSHEIRTPLNGVIGMSNLMFDTQLDATQTAYMETVRSSAEGLLTVLNDILDFSKMEAGKLELDEIDFDVHREMRNAVDLLAAEAATKGLDLSCVIAPEVPRHVRGDPGRLRQVLLNLIGNAVKFTEHGEVAAEVVCLASIAGEIALRFSVRDTGIGLSPEQQARLFQPFSQADSSTTRRFGGTGLGLAICRQLVELMGGQIGVQSAFGKGACFSFNVVLRAAHAPGSAAGRTPPAAEAASAGPPATAAPPSAALRILVVEDHQVNQRLIRLQLRKLGYTCEIASNGAEALQMLDRAPFDVVLMDCQMPVMDGYEATRQLRSNPAHAGTPVIAMTANAMQGDRERCLAAGMDDYLAKPLRIEELHRALLHLPRNAPQPACKKDSPECAPVERRKRKRISRSPAWPGGRSAVDDRQRS